MSFWHDLGTVFHLSREVTALRSRVDELELEWLDKRDSIDKLVRRLTVRAVRGGDGTEAPPPIVQPEASSLDKNSLRHLARTRGML